MEESCSKHISQDGKHGCGELFDPEKVGEINFDGNIGTVVHMAGNIGTGEYIYIYVTGEHRKHG